MHAYHEITADSLKSVLKNGLKATDRGKKGDDSTIANTDKFLDERRPETIRTNGVARTAAIYAYLATGTYVIDITDGSHARIPDFIRRSEDIILELAVEPSRCYVADLDAFDAVMDAIRNNHPSEHQEQLAEKYWQTLVRLDSYRIDTFKRPEILIPYDIDPDAITIAREA